jgi:mannose-6-phosphate isomerase-like protein (cupin superfamily)
VTQPEPGPYVLNSTFLRLRPDASVEPLHLGNDFWQRLMSGKLGTFHNEYLLSTFAYERDWPNWEKHPNGDEVVMLLEGRTTMVLELDGRERLVELAEPCSYVVIPRGAWHTARTSVACRMLALTAGEGTEHRPV